MDYFFKSTDKQYDIILKCFHAYLDILKVSVNSGNLILNYQIRYIKKQISYSEK